MSSIDHQLFGNTGKLTIKMAFFIPSRNPSKGTRAVWRTLHTEYEITQDEATEFAKWFKQENESHPRHEGNPYAIYEWQAYPVTVVR
jgi:hypothetical protein